MLPLIILTPVRNEGWILDRFLAVHTRVADGILIADQCSTDDSRAICQRYSGVRIVENEGVRFNEAERQLLLLSRAREIWPGPKVLLALDADEIVAADAQESEQWNQVRTAPVGASIYLSKPDLMPGLARCVLYPELHPFGFVDDGESPHCPKQIHSQRLPQLPGGQRVSCPAINVLHYGLTRIEPQMAKVRYYAVQEHLMGTNPLHRRRAYYGGFRSRQYGATMETAVPVQESWFEGWERMGIDMRTVGEPPFAWQTLEVLRAMANHGERRFWLDPIWDYDWESARQEAIRSGWRGIPDCEITGPSAIYRLAGKCLDAVVAGARSVLR